MVSQNHRLLWVKTQTKNTGLDDCCERLLCCYGFARRVLTHLLRTPHEASLKSAKIGDLIDLAHESLMP